MTPAPDAGDPLRPVRGIMNGVAFGLLLWLTIIGLFLLAWPAYANNELVLQQQQHVNLTRPISVVLTEKAASLCGQDEAYGCAKFAFEPQARCVIYLHPARLQYLYHELQHCAGLTHEPPRS